MNASAAPEAAAKPVARRLSLAERAAAGEHSTAGKPSVVGEIPAALKRILPDNTDDRKPVDVAAFSSSI